MEDHVIAGLAFLIGLVAVGIGVYLERVRWNYLINVGRVAPPEFRWREAREAVEVSKVQYDAICAALRVFPQGEYSADLESWHRDALRDLYEAKLLFELTLEKVKEDGSNDLVGGRSHA